MAYPKVSIIWLNYNSMSFIDLVLESLRAVAELDYPGEKYELIVVDNGSSDGSFEKIKEFLEKRESLRKKVIKLSHNLGFAGGNNIGFKARDRESKYIVLLNNDAVPFKESLKTMVEYAEQYNVGALNGIILKYGSGDIIDTAGDFLDEILCPYHVGSGNRAPWIIKKPFYITYADGAYVLYNVKSVLKSMGERLFFEEFFGYGDDNILGLTLWHNNFKIISIPVVVAKHKRGSSFGRGQTTINAYLSNRVRVALLYLTNVKRKDLVWLHIIRTTLTKVHKRDIFKRIVRAYYDGLKLSEIVRRKFGVSINIYKAPIIRVSLEEFAKYYMAGTKTTLLNYIEGKISKLVRILQVE